MASGMVVKPFVKWAGGKSRLVPELLSRVPATIKTYAEPFAGGAALFFALVGTRGTERARAFDRAVLADQNEELMAAYRAVKARVDDVIAALSRYRYDRELFYEVRERDTQGMDDVERAARLIFLNRTCFNGLWRVNAEGRFNVPFGRYKNPRIVDEEGLRAASDALKGADLVRGDFVEVTASLGPGDFVYLDPPYSPITKTADFTSYTAGGFRSGDQVRLANELRSLRERGVLAMLSNADNAETRALYADFAVHVVGARRAINSNPKKRGVQRELIVTSWGVPGFYDAAIKRPRRLSGAKLAS
jgi:DNA adenine methylase